ncbi:MAG: hypothetical protein V3R87_02985, partial [Dehalococcoidia bacterium]
DLRDSSAHQPAAHYPDFLNLHTAPFCVENRYRQLNIADAMNEDKPVALRRCSARTYGLTISTD